MDLDQAAEHYAQEQAFFDAGWEVLSGQRPFYFCRPTPDEKVGALRSVAHTLTSSQGPEDGWDVFWIDGDVAPPPGAAIGGRTLYIVVATTDHPSGWDREWRPCESAGVSWSFAPEEEDAS